MKNKINYLKTFLKSNFSTDKYKFNITRIDSWEKNFRLKFFKLMLKIQSKNVFDVGFIFKLFLSFFNVIQTQHAMNDHDQNPKQKRFWHRIYF